MNTAPARWARILEDAEASELTQSAFARANGINPRTLSWWKWKLRQEPEPGGAEGDEHPVGVDFVEVLMAPAPPPQASMRVQLGDRAVHALVELDTDMTLLRRVVEALC